MVFNCCGLSAQTDGIRGVVKMKCTYLHGGSCFDEVTPDGRTAARRIASHMKAPMQTLCALAAVAAVGLALAAARCPATASGNTIPDDFSMNDNRPDEERARDISGGIQNPLDPQAYMQQLAARMGAPRRDLLLNETTALNTKSASRPRSAPVTGQRRTALPSPQRPAPTIPGATDVKKTQAGRHKTIPSTFGGAPLGVRAPEGKARLGVVAVAVFAVVVALVPAVLVILALVSLRDDDVVLGAVVATVVAAVTTAVVTAAVIARAGAVRQG